MTMEYKEYNQGVQRHFSDLVKFPGVNKVDDKTKHLKTFNVLWFLLNVTDE